MGYENYAAWQSSAEGARYQGRWVLLTDDYEVIDSADDAAELLAAHPEIRAPFLCWVMPQDAVLIPTLYRLLPG